MGFRYKIVPASLGNVLGYLGSVARALVMCRTYPGSSLALRLRRLLNPSEGPAFEPLISRGARGPFPLRGRIPFGLSPFPVPVVRERKRKRKRIRNRMTWRTFLTRSLWRRRSVARFSCQRCRLSRRGVNATGRVVHGAAVSRVRAVRGTEHGRAVFTPRERVPLLSLDGT
jgi:hypothetical protein